MLHKDRQAQAIEKAYSNADPEALEQALRAYADEDEQVIIFTVRNSRSNDLNLFVEPWGEAYILSSGSNAAIFLCEPKIATLKHRILHDIDDANVIIYASTGAVYYVLQNVKLE